MEEDLESIRLNSKELMCGCITLRDSFSEILDLQLSLFQYIWQQNLTEITVLSLFFQHFDFLIPFLKTGNPNSNPFSLSLSLFPDQISEIYVSGESGDLTAKEKLLLWSQQATEGYPGLRCVNFTSSWSDGRMFNALLHRYRLEDEH